MNYNPDFVGYNFDEVKDGVEHILYGLGVDLEHPNFKGTPDRVARSYREFCRGLYDQKEVDAILSTIFPSTNDEIVSMADIDAIGLCPHHLLPIRYLIHVGYIPAEDGLVLGASKIPRLACLLAARPILQEDLAPDIVNILEEKLSPLGVMVIVYGKHSCMQCRGIMQSNSRMITSAVTGCFADKNSDTKSEFLALLRKI